MFFHGSILGEPLFGLELQCGIERLPLVSYIFGKAEQPVHFERAAVVEDELARIVPEELILDRRNGEQVDVAVAV
jgi:hypothetical protein